MPAHTVRLATSDGLSTAIEYVRRRSCGREGVGSLMLQTTILIDDVLASTVGLLVIVT